MKKNKLLILEDNLHLEKNINHKKDQINELIEYSTSVQSLCFRLNKISIKKNRDKISNVLVKIDLMIAEYLKEILQLLILKAYSKELINSLEKKEHKLILKLKYIEHLKNEEIAEEMGYSTRHISRILKSAIESLEKI